MDILKVTPPFAYSYQCGSTILVSYIPIYMYSITIQIFVVLSKFVLIFFPNLLPRLLRSKISGVAWPLFWDTTVHSPAIVDLIDPSQIASSTVNSLILFLTFGLCSPVLALYLLFSVAITLCSWIYLVGRFIDLRRQSLSSSTTSSADDAATVPDPFVVILNDQLKGFSRYFLVCKWPISIASTLFITVLCWDMAADQIGWKDSLWVPGVGILFILQLWICDNSSFQQFMMNLFTQSPKIFYPQSQLNHQEIEIVPTIFPPA